MLCKSVNVSMENFLILIVVVLIFVGNHFSKKYEKYMRSSIAKSEASKVEDTLRVEEKIRIGALCVLVYVHLLYRLSK